MRQPRLVTAEQKIADLAGGNAASAQWAAGMR
eukprot:SAG31_NODE_12470_length_939_cov_1.234524_1_plen_31_part_10